MSSAYPDGVGSSSALSGSAVPSETGVSAGPSPASSSPSSTGVESEVEEPARRRPMSVRPMHWVRQAWRTSLQFRVVAMTILVGTLLTVALQSFLYGRIADGLMSARKSTAMTEAAEYGQNFREQLDGTDRTSSDEIQTFARDYLLKQQTRAPDQSREVIFIQSIDAPTAGSAVDGVATGPSWTELPEELRHRTVEDPTVQQVQTVPITLDDGTVTPAVVVGTLVQVPELGPHELYYVFPLQHEERIMAVVQRVFVVGSFALVATLGLIAFIVTRLVVDPLRQAAEVAGRLSTGHLNERMLVRGEDDIARLATSFNDMAEHLQNQIHELEELSQLQQRFVSDVSHELRTPLTTIHMASEMLHDQRDTMDPVLMRSTELLHAQVERFEDLLADLLEISRFDAKGAALEADTVDMSDLVARTLIGVQQLAEARGSEIVVVGGEEPHPAAMDARRVERILRNLMVNAIEHGEGRPITVQLASDEQAVAVVVADQGIGLKPGQASMVFNRFWRADPSRKRTTGGTGLGLAISLEDAHLHHGWLQAWGAEGQGARFRLTLPIEPGVTLSASPLPLEPPPPAAEDEAVAVTDAAGDPPSVPEV